jgi:hypothetical protein
LSVISKLRPLHQKLAEQREKVIADARRDRRDAGQAFGVAKIDHLNPSARLNVDPGNHRLGVEVRRRPLRRRAYGHEKRNSAIDPAV